MPSADCVEVVHDGVGLEHLAVFPDRPVTFLGSWKVGILSRSTTMALTFFEPMTAPTPPRAARRDGPPVGIGEGDAAIKPRYSPTGPHSASVTFLPYFSNSMCRASKLPLPRYGAASSNSMAVLGEADDHPVGRRAVEGEPGDLHLAEGVANVPPPFDSLIRR